MTRRRRFRHGTVYCLRGRRTSWWRLRRYYIGQTRYRDYTKRVEQHLYGYWYDGVWNPPKYWAAEVVDYYPLWSGERWCDWGLNVREFLCIRIFLPVHNVLLNTGNPRRIIPPPVDMRVYPTRDQITAVERVIPLKSVRRWLLNVLRFMSWLTLAGIGVLFIPGLPGATLAGGTWGWLRVNAATIGGLVLVSIIGWVITQSSSGKRRTKTGRRSTTRRKHSSWTSRK